MKIKLWQKEESWWTEKERNEHQSTLMILNAIKEKWNKYNNNGGPMYLLLNL